MLLGMDWPVELGRVVIAPTFVEPQLRIGIEFLVLIETLHARWITGFPNPKGTYPKLHVRLGGLDLMVEGFDELVHLIPSPIIATKLTPSLQIFFPGWIVWKGDIVDWIRIKIIIDVDAVDIVPFDDIEKDAQSVLTGFRFTWIEPQVRGFVVAVSFDQFGVSVTDMVRRLGVFLP